MEYNQGGGSSTVKTREQPEYRQIHYGSWILVAIDIGTYLHCVVLLFAGNRLERGGQSSARSLVVRLVFFTRSQLKKHNS